jgi:hypothetical protein
MLDLPLSLGEGASFFWTFVFILPDMKGFFLVSILSTAEPNDAQNKT